MIKNVKVGDVIKLISMTKFEVIRHNDRNNLCVKQILLSSSYIHVVEKTKKYILIACYDGESYPDDNFYVIRLYDGDFLIKGHCENTKRGAIYYKEDYFGYVGEDENYVYLAHYSVYEDKIEAMRKVMKDEYYKCAISINAFDYAEQCYNPKWGLVGKELR
jgi:hypothetical protein